MAWVDPASLTDNPANWRRHPEGQITALREVIDDPAVGWAGVLLFNERTGRLIDGHARKKVAIARGDKAVPVVIGSWDEAAERKILLTLDPLAGLAQPDPVQLRTLMEAVALNGDALKSLSDGLGDMLKSADLAAAQAVAVVEDTPPDAADVEKRCAEGDLWSLGTHRLLCGDSTKAENVARLLGGAVPFIMVTDPPYGVEYDPEWREGSDLGVGKRSKGKVENDDRVDWSETYSLFPGAVAYVWHASFYTIDVGLNLRTAGFDIRSSIIWRKQHFAMSRGHYHWQHEPCWYVVRKGASAKWCGDRTQSTTWEIANNNSFGNANAEETWGHGTQKPVECMARPIRNHGGKDDDVYDPFGGSGTTIIAAEQLGRRCFMLELSTTYCDVILARWEKLTGKKAEKVP
jgi:DNA modification methylase